MSEHTIKAFDTELQELVRKVAEMGGLAERQITDAIAALIKRDTAQAERVMAIDTNIDALQREIEEKGILIIARRQPMAVDLREVVGALRVSNDLERIGDLAKNIGKRVIALSLTDSRGGQVFFEGERWNAVSETPIEPGQSGEVTGRNGLTLNVKPTT